MPEENAVIAPPTAAYADVVNPTREARPNWLLPYGIALAATLAAVLLRALLAPLLGSAAPYATLFLAIIAAVAFGGWKPGLLSTVLGFLLGDYYFVEPVGTWLPNSHAGWISGGMYFINSLCVLLLCETLRTARRHAEIHALEARRYADSLLKESEERRQAQDTLRTREARLRTLAEALPQFVWLSNGDGSFQYLNKQWTDYTGLTLEQMKNPEWTRVIHPDDLSTLIGKWEESRQTGLPYEAEFRCRRTSDGAFRWFLCRSVPLRDADGQITQWVGSSTDIDERKRTQREIAELNVRLQRAMQETHHRIKNNLQSIAALTDMQDTSADALIPAREFRRIGAHTRALAEIHDLLTQQARTDAADFDFLSVRAVLHQLLPVLRDMAGERRLLFTADDALLPIKIGTSLAFLVNELVGNALKHGAGDITLTLRLLENAAQLEVCDEGPGFPPDFSPLRHQNTGLELIESTGKWDLHGQVSYENRPEGGARVLVTFPLAIAATSA